ncbi:RIIa domain-containing protein 1 isoform X1 [Lontra canadensis]|uniref:RIIa domain-containing protein 1 isoform X1 n=1 Tax=Lontra canadensis TaxID=76717 RepID=UPI0013F3510E|nr:RIIa domain-containing protein 1 isoform X1 [Lontra canadensis]
MATLQGGLLGPDPGALSPAQQEQLRNFKIQTRIANEKYLRTHKEVELLISGFFREIFLKRPDNIQEFSAAPADTASDSHYAGCIKTILCRHRVRSWLSSERIFSERRGRESSETSWQAELRRE